MIRYIITGISKEGVRGNIFSNNKTYPTLKGVKRAMLTYEECFTPDVELRYEEIEIETELEVARKEIASLKAQLKRERDCVDFYADKRNVNEMINGTGDDFEEVDGRYHGGKLARETVNARGL